MSTPTGIGATIGMFVLAIVAAIIAAGALGIGFVMWYMSFLCWPFFVVGILGLAVMFLAGYRIHQHNNHQGHQ